MTENDAALQCPTGCGPMYVTKTVGGVIEGLKFIEDKAQGASYSSSCPDCGYVTPARSSPAGITSEVNRDTR